MKKHLHAVLTDLQSIRRDNYWTDRALGQLDFAVELSRLQDHCHAPLLTTVSADLLHRQERDGALGKGACENLEQALAPLQEAAKAYTLLCVGHAHIDMNWMWSWQETVSITIESLRTMLDLMDEYPGFTFGQSQASVYQIIADYAPEMLPAIRRHVQEGRWEVTASHWVEADKNMPNAESMVRHLLYTRRYLADLLEISPEQLNLDFEPDTFGHSLHIPEILAQGGIRYYYHCRGADDHDIYRWIAPSGKALLAYREPLWYNATFETQWARFVPSFCQRHGLRSFLKVYGVGDHGGGPTRRDLNRILDMDSWPIFPTIRFGTYGEWFDLLDSKMDTWPEVHGERNFIFTGCYSSQSRIKAGNRLGEDALYKAEWANAAATALTRLPYPSPLFARGWQNILFNQFHDILPGSGVLDTREHAMGLYQEAQAIATARQTLAYRAITSAIDTTAFGSVPEQPTDSIAEGGGVGYGISCQAISQTARAGGSTRLFTIFNPSTQAETRVIEAIIWDWQGPHNHLCAVNADGHSLPCQVLEDNLNQYWGHQFLRVLVEVPLPACGYETIAFRNQPPPLPEDDPFAALSSLRLDTPLSYVLENDHLRCAFDPVTFAIESYLDKTTGQQLVSATAPAQFRLIQEDPHRGMTAWRVGRYLDIATAHQHARLKELKQGNDLLRQSLQFEATFGRSTLKVTYSLDRTAHGLDILAECDWHEIGNHAKTLPHLHFHTPLSYLSRRYLYDTPLGVIQRDPRSDDTPGLSWILGRQEADDACSLRLLTDTKYGYRGDQNALTATLIRSSCDPDPYPEYGLHQTRLRLETITDHHPDSLINSARGWRLLPEVMATRHHQGTLPPSQSLFRLECDGVILLAVKAAEDDSSSLILRFAETRGKQTSLSVQTSQPINNATLVDLHEQPTHQKLPQPEDRTIRMHIDASSLLTVRLEFAE